MDNDSRACALFARAMVTLPLLQSQRMQTLIALLQLTSALSLTPSINVQQQQHNSWSTAAFSW